MAMKGDFMGFTFNGVHSSELNILRVSTGDRYEENILPEIKDSIAEAADMEGQYFFGAHYGERTININIAYDSLTDSDLRKLKKVFNGRQVCDLIFDEFPYKKYLAKVAQPIELQYICFDEDLYDEVLIGKGIKDRDIIRKNSNGKRQRIYKGEGTIEFICYYPFAKSIFKILPTNEPDPETGEIPYPTYDEWSVECGLLSIEEFENNKVDVARVVNDTYEVALYNPGEMQTPCRIYFPFAYKEDGIDKLYEYDNLRIDYKDLNDNSLVKDSIIIEGLVRQSKEDTGFLINTETGLIQGVIATLDPHSGNNIYTLNNTIYNQFMKKGSFFSIQPNSYSNESHLVITGSPCKPEEIDINYNYLYL